MSDNARRIARVAAAVVSEVVRAQEMHDPMNSPHEGYAVLKEEVDELWHEVKRNCGRGPMAAREAKQIAAMGIRYLVDLMEDEVLEEL